MDKSIAWILEGFISSQALKIINQADIIIIRAKALAKKHSNWNEILTSCITQNQNKWWFE